LIAAFESEIKRRSFNPSPAVPNGLGDEDAIRAFWMAAAAKSAAH
jgi:hypothetical protein